MSDFTVKYSFYAKSLRHSEVDMAIHNKLFYLLHYRRNGVTWPNIAALSMHKYVIKLAITVGEWTACMQVTAQGKDFKLILTVKMDTRHP